MDVFVRRAEESLDHTADYYKGEDVYELWPHEEEVKLFDGYRNGHGFYYEDEEEDDDYGEINSQAQEEQEEDGICKDDELDCRKEDGKSG